MRSSCSCSLIRNSPQWSTICRCKKCKGNKTVKDKTRQEIYIERGMADRQRVVLAGGGDEEVFVVLASCYVFWLNDL